MNEITPRSAGADDRGRPLGGGRGQQSPLQTRAAFLKNWSWQLVISLNRAACARGSAQHGPNPQVGDACQRRWEETRLTEPSLLEVLDFLREQHRSAPFLSFNGNTFADLGRRLCDALFGDLPLSRRRELASSVAHYIAGVLDRDSMIGAVESLCESASLVAGDRVQTLKGSTTGTVVKILGDGRVSWRPDGIDGELIGLPEGLKKMGG